MHPGAPPVRRGLRGLLQRLRPRSAPQTAEEAVEREAHEEARLRSYPQAPYPEGWYAVAWSHDVGRRPLEITAFGGKLVAFRSAGRVAVLDAHCPHMGANLAQGRLRGDCIECPFHHWRLAADGAVAHVPYAQHVPPRLRTRAHAVDERHGLVFLYHRPEAEAGPPAPPPYPIPPIPEIDSGQLRHRGRLDAGLVRMHVLEFLENSGDLRHFAALHGDMFLPWTSLRVPGLRVSHEASWEQDRELPHTAWFRDRAALQIGSWRVPGTGADARIRFIGAGGVVWFSFELERLGTVVLYHLHTPERPLVQRVRFSWFASPEVPRLLAHYVVGSWVSQWREDVRIWQGKIFRPRPLLVPEDGPIHRVRRYYAQFLPRPRDPAPAL